jgi:hypothetical protein
MGQQKMAYSFTGYIDLFFLKCVANKMADSLTGKISITRR